MSVLRAGGPVRAIAHRGEPVGHRENTLPSLQAALWLRADLIEIDVATTADGHVVLLHDPTLARLWGDPAPVAEVTLAGLARFAEAGPGIPLLTDALAVVAGTATSLLIDVADPAVAAPAVRVVATAVADGLDADQVAWCGALDALTAVRSQDAAARILLTWNGPVPPTQAVVAQVAPEAFNPGAVGMAADAAAWAHARGMAACCWTIDDDATMTELLDRGFDALITNRIATLRKVVDARA